MNVVISNQLREFSAQTLCLYDPVVGFNLTSGVATYNVRDTQYFDREMVKVQKVTINSEPLYNLQGVQGATSLDELATNYPRYLTDELGTPKHFAQIPPHHIRLYPKPDADGQTNACSVSGWYLHATLTGTGATDSTLLTIPEEYQRAAAYFTATALLIPSADGDVDYGRLQLLTNQTQVAMQELRQRSLQLLEGPTVRGLKRARNLFGLG